MPYFPLLNCILWRNVTDEDLVCFGCLYAPMDVVYAQFNLVIHYPFMVFLVFQTNYSTACNTCNTCNTPVPLWIDLVLIYLL